jgi:hypothetical protein
MTFLMRPILPILLNLLFLSGCFSIQLISDQPVKDLERLVRSAKSPVALLVQNPESDFSCGYQFLFGVIPLTRVFVQSASDAVVAKLQLHAGQAGIGLHQNLTVNRSTSEKTPRLEVSVISISVNGYDLIFFRRPSASISLRATLFTEDNAPRICEASGQHSEFSRFAFARELNEALGLATDLAAQKLLTCLGLV